MKRALFTIALAAVITALFAMGAHTAQAQSKALTPDQIERIRGNCTSIKSTLNQLYASDALLRVNRGQVYESMATRLMDPFNERLNNNRLDAKATMVATTSYRNALDTFRNDYRSYKDKLSSAIRVDCTTQPEEFYANLEQARTLRTKVHDDVIKLHRYLDDYRTAVDDFLLNFERVSQ